ncbi:MAG: gfo/Idh/MocA family oxidoreductase, partial [Caldilineae bacterium]
FEIAGSEGLLVHDSAATAPIQVFWHTQAGEDAGEVPVPASPLLESPYATQIKAFYQHIHHDAPLPVTAEDGLAALRVALAAIESAEQGRAVDIEE